MEIQPKRTLSVLDLFLPSFKPKPKRLPPTHDEIREFIFQQITRLAERGASMAQILVAMAEETADLAGVVEGLVEDD